MKLNILFCMLFVIDSVFTETSYLINTDLNEDWVIFKTKFLKIYKTGEEELRRRLIWEDNLRLIQKHNLEYDLGKHTFTTGINQFTDLFFEEFRSIYLPKMFSVESIENTSYYLPPLNIKEEVTSIDWRKHGYVTEVKNQGHCGSCWSFSSTGSLEGQHFRKYHKLLSLSEQQLVDCSGKFENHGCNGGLMENAFKYIKAIKGIESENVYPYVAQQQKCTFNLSKVVSKVQGYQRIKATEAALAKAVAHVGPISIAIDASHPTFQHYKSGIYSEPQCNPNHLDHAVLVVGFGKDSSQSPYWIVKNSWGSQWGIKGYILMTKDQNNQCGVATMAGYPLI